MLYLSFVLSAVALLVANVAARRQQLPVLSAVACGVGGLLTPLLMCGSTVPVGMQVAGLLVLVFLARTSGLTPRSFIPCSLVVTAAPYAWLVFIADGGPGHYARLRETFPFESVESRVPLLPARPGPALTAGADVAALEERLEEDARGHASDLRYVHEGKVQQFVNNPGFGVGRMVPRSEKSIRYAMHNEPAPDQPADANPSVLVPAGALPPYPEASSMTGLHATGLLDFLHPKGFGYVRDRQHVAGFQSHGFSKVPESKAPWQVGRLELVSLLLHKEPVVYVSPRLPRMDELRDVQTRPLDSFEAEGLAAVRAGEDVYVRDARMMGAVRSTKQCLACHGGNRGDLLGAFSYVLRPATGGNSKP